MRIIEHYVQKILTEEVKNKRQVYKNFKLFNTIKSKFTNEFNTYSSAAVWSIPNDLYNEFMYAAQDDNEFKYFCRNAILHRHDMYFFNTALLKRFWNLPFNHKLKSNDILIHSSDNVNSQFFKITSEALLAIVNVCNNIDEFMFLLKECYEKIA